jgi:hypothetical protein
MYYKEGKNAWQKEEEIALNPPACCLERQERK